MAAGNRRAHGHKKGGKTKRKEEKPKKALTFFSRKNRINGNKKTRDFGGTPNKTERGGKTVGAFQEKLYA